MKVKKNGIRIIIAAGSLVLLLCVALLWSQSLMQKQYVDIATTVVELDIDGLVKGSDLIVEGEITEISDPIIIQPLAESEPSIFTDYSIRISKTYRGAAKDEIVNLRLQGGETEKVVVTSDAEPQLKLGENYVFFLERPVWGSRYHVAGDYYYPVGGSQGVLNEVKKERLSITDEANQKAEADHYIQTDTEVFLTNAPYIKEKQTYIMQENVELFSEQGLSSKINALNEAFPMDPYRLVREMEPDLVAELENKEISEESYLEQMQKAYPYATVLETFPAQDQAKTYGLS